MNKQLRIAMFGHKRVPSREGGIEIVVEQLAVRMVERGHEVTCFNRKGHHISGTEFDAEIGNVYNGVHLKSIFTIDRKGIAALTASVSAAFHSAFGKYDVVHVHAEGPAFMCWLPKLFGKKVIVTVHGLDHQRAKWGKFASWYILSGEKNAVKYADEIIVLSRNVQEYFEKVYGRKTVFIPNGVIRPVIKEALEIKKEWGLEKDSYVLYLGRIVPEKGLRYLIEAWKGIKSDKRLVIAGGSSDTEDFMNELKSSVGNDVIFTGFRQDRVLEELYSNAYVYVLPSDLEGMPLSLLEAMSYGNCCIVSDIPECTEVVEDKGVVFMKSNAGDLREKLQMLCDNADMVRNYKMGAADFVCEKYDWDDVTDRTLRLYQ